MTDDPKPEPIAKGGSYIRHPDGKLDRVEFTKPAAGRTDAPVVTPKNPFDHDGDGKPGGSLPKSKRAATAKETS